MNKRERIMATLKGEDVDRPPVSFWRHFYKEETTHEGLAEAMLGFQGKYDWDFMKVNPRAEYHVEDWGNRYEYSGDDFIKISAEHHHRKLVFGGFFIQSRQLGF